MEKLTARLYYARNCRLTLLSRNYACQSVPGAGSQEEQHAHDRLLPPLQAEGPHPQPQRLGEDTEVDTDLHMSFMEIFLDAEDVDDAVRMIPEKPETSPVSRTTWTSTMDFFIETLEEADVQRWDFPRQMGSGRALRGVSARAR